MQSGRQTPMEALAEAVMRAKGVRDGLKAAADAGIKAYQQMKDKPATEGDARQP